jgi:hypothetical protein
MNLRKVGHPSPGLVRLTSHESENASTQLAFWMPSQSNAQRTVAWQRLLIRDFSVRKVCVLGRFLRVTDQTKSATALRTLGQR